MRALPESFFCQPADILAPGLLGKTLIHHTEAGITAGVIVEAEAYCGLEDPAAHSYRRPDGRTADPSGRTAIMYGPGGHAYIYLIYGIHHCFNVVAGPEGDPQGVLVRALEPREGLSLMVRRRYGSCFDRDGPPGLRVIRGLCSGPGKLTAAMGISRAQYGLGLWAPPLMVAETEGYPPFKIDASPRVGVDYAGEAARWPYRFTVRGSPWLSVPAAPQGRAT